MNNAALAAGATVSFTFLNSTIATTDVVVISCASGSAASAYRAGISQTTSGAATVTVTNFSGGSLSEALVLNFAVIKAVTA
jgi:expansin (peptidoglycan-binding protein)